MGGMAADCDGVEPAAAEEERVPPERATCPICISILIHPVTTPCQHTICKPCFDRTIEQASICCPICRKRLSVWLRRSRKSGGIVDDRLWQRLQRQYPQKIQARLDGDDVEFSEEAEAPPVRLRLSAPGEIRAEFEQQLATARHEELERSRRGEHASRRLIERLQQETAERQQQEQQDARVARGVLRRELLLASPVQNLKLRRGPMDVYIGQLTPKTTGKRPVSPGRGAGSAITPSSVDTSRSVGRGTPPSSSPATAGASSDPVRPSGSGPGTGPQSSAAGTGKENHDPKTGVATDVRQHRHRPKAGATSTALPCSSSTARAADAPAPLPAACSLLVRTLSDSDANTAAPTAGQQRAARVHIAATTSGRRAVTPVEPGAVGDRSTDDGASPLLARNKRNLPGGADAAPAAKRRPAACAFTSAVTSTVTSAVTSAVTSTVTSAVTSAVRLDGAEDGCSAGAGAAPPSPCYSHSSVSTVVRGGEAAHDCDDDEGPPTLSPYTVVMEAADPTDEAAAEEVGPAAAAAADPAVADWLRALDWVSPQLLAEQREAERRLQLERADRQLAERLQDELNRPPPPVDRSKGSADAYSLRGGAVVAPRRARSRQLSIEEALRRRRSGCGHPRTATR